MNIKTDIIIKRLEYLKDLISELESIKKIPKEEFLDDFTTILAAQRALVLAINICIDIGAHIIASNGIAKPETYKEIFKELRKNNVISKDLETSLTKFVGLRNLLGHVYIEIDNERIFEIIQKDVLVFTTFQKQLLKKFKDQLKK